MYEKYVTAIKFADRLIEVGKEPARLEELHTLFDEALTFLGDNFESPTRDKTLITEAKNVLFPGREKDGSWKNNSEELLKYIPPTISDAVWPIAFTRLLLKEYKLPIEPSKLKRFDWFHKTYGWLVVVGSDTK